MAATKIKVFKVDCIEILNISNIATYLGVSKSTILRKYKNSKTFECKGKIIEHYTKKQEHIGLDERLKKECTSCKTVLPNNTEYFRLDSSKVKLGHTVILSSRCIKCQEKRKSEFMRTKRLGLRELGTTLYRETPLPKRLHHISRNIDYAKKNKDKINASAKNRRLAKTTGVLNANIKSKINHRKMVLDTPDYYIARLIFKNNKELTIKELLEYPELLDLHRANLKLKRVCNQLTMSMN